MRDYYHVSKISSSLGDAGKPIITVTIHELSDEEETLAQRAKQQRSTSPVLSNNLNRLGTFSNLINALNWRSDIEYEGFEDLETLLDSTTLVSVRFVSPLRTFCTQY
jgi:hypothetical protein